MRFVLSAVAVVATAGVVSASPLDLISTQPDVASGFVTVTYNAGTHAFMAVGFTQTLDLPPPQPLNNRLFLLTAVIDNAGNATGGTLEVRGDYGGVDQVLFRSTDLMAFGFGAVDLLEFIFIQESGSLADVGAQIGTILGANVGTFPGGVPDFTQSFTNAPNPPVPGAGVADTFVIPAPGAACAAGIVCLFAARRRRS